MPKLNTKYNDLPEPIALTVEQLEQVAAQTAGGASLATALSAGIICGGRPALDAMTSPAINMANVQQQFAF